MKFESIGAHHPAIHRKTYLHELLKRAETETGMKAGPEESFSGYGIPGIQFSSGHVLVLRRFPASSIGPAYTEVWHRGLNGIWKMYTDVDPQYSSARYFGRNLLASIETPVELSWSDTFRLQIALPKEDLYWNVQIQPSFRSRFVNTVLKHLPSSYWRNRRPRRLMEAMAEGVLSCGKINLEGTAPNGQRYRSEFRGIWEIGESRAWWGNIDLGEMKVPARQTTLGDLLIPKRGFFAVGDMFFEPFDISRHSLQTNQYDDGTGYGYDLSWAVRQPGSASPVSDFASFAA